MPRTARNFSPPIRRKVVGAYKPRYRRQGAAALPAAVHRGGAMRVAARAAAASSRLAARCVVHARRRRSRIPDLAAIAVAAGAGARRLARDFRHRDARARAGLHAARSGSARAAGKAAGGQPEFVQTPADYIKEIDRAARRRRPQALRSISRAAHRHRTPVRHAAGRRCSRSSAARPITAARPTSATPSACWRRRPISASARRNSSTNF